MRRVSQDSPSTPKAFSISGRISSTPRALPLWSCLTTSVTSPREMNDDPPASSSASTIDGGLDRFRSSSECSFHRPITFSVEVNSVPVPRFTLLRCRMVFQKRFGADRKSFSMASPTSSHTRCFASVTADAPVLGARRYLATASGVPWDNTSRKASFFSWMASLTTGVHQGVQGLPPLEVFMTLRPQLPAAALAK